MFNIVKKFNKIQKRYAVTFYRVREVQLCNVLQELFFENSEHFKRFILKNIRLKSSLVSLPQGIKDEYYMTNRDKLFLLSEI